MRIIFYKNLSEKNRVDKTSFITEKLRVLGNFRETQDITNPSILIESDNTILQCNYAYIEELNRYYYINSIQTYTNTAFILNMSCDVLMSFKNDIMNIKGEVVRNQYNYNDNLYDNRKAFSEKREYQKIDIPTNVFNVDNPQYNYVIITTKGATT